MNDIEIKNYKRKVNFELNQLIKSAEWEKALALIIRNEKLFNKDHWILANKSIIYYEKRNYKKALILINDAYNMAPICPLVNDYKASIERMLGNYHIAIEIWKNLLSQDIEELAYDECGEGMKWALSLLNDARYMLALTYFDIKDYDKALDFINKHIENRKKGQYSVVTKRKAISKKNKILNEMNTDI